MAEWQPQRAREEREFVTSEGVDLRLRLGSVGERLGAFMLDLLILVVTLIVFTIAAGFAFAGSGGGPNGAGAEVIGSIWLLVFFFLRNGYFIAFELGMRAATLGKRAMKLRVVARDGGRLTGEAVVARNAMRELEIYLPLSFLIQQSGEGAAGMVTWLAGLAWVGVFALFPFFNRDRLRVGDLVAGTWVVRVPRKRLGRAVVQHQAVPSFVFSEAQLNAYGEFELQKLEEVLRREEELSVIVVARTIRTRIGWTGGEGNDLEFLKAYYAALCERLERNMLFGKRRRDKHQKA